MHRAMGHRKGRRQPCASCTPYFFNASRFIPFILSTSAARFPCATSVTRSGLPPDAIHNRADRTLTPNCFFSLTRQRHAPPVRLPSTASSRAVHYLTGHVGRSMDIWENELQVLEAGRRSARRPLRSTSAAPLRVPLQTNTGIHRLPQDRPKVLNSHLATEVGWGKRNWKEAETLLATRSGRRYGEACVLLQSSLPAIVFMVLLPQKCT